MNQSAQNDPGLGDVLDQPRERRGRRSYPRNQHPISADGELVARRASSTSELWFESGVVFGSNAGKSTSFWRERTSRGNVAFIVPLGHLWLGVGVF